jgi:hypothetical protein
MRVGGGLLKNGVWLGREREVGEEELHIPLFPFQPGGHVTDPIPIADWLTSYKLMDYIPMFVQGGYDSTDFLQGLTSDELLEIGVSKPGHKKKILAAFASLRHKEHLIMTKPVMRPHGSN